MEFKFKLKKATGTIIITGGAPLKVAVRDKEWWHSMPTISATSYLFGAEINSYEIEFLDCFLNLARIS